MKHTGAKMEYYKERIDDLMTRYDEYILLHEHIYMPEVYSTIVNMPSRRFWVSDNRATFVVSKMLHGEEDITKSMWPTKKEMYEEICRRVKAMMQEFPEHSIYELCSIAIEQPAPKFYITPGTAKIMICKAKRKWQEEKLRKLYLL